MKKVDGGYDCLKAKVPIFPEDSIEEVEAKTVSKEYQIYPLVIQMVYRRAIELKDNLAYLDGKALPNLDMQMNNLEFS